MKPRDESWTRYTWYQCTECGARVVRGWRYLHDKDCSLYADDERMHPEPRFSAAGDNRKYDE